MRFFQLFPSAIFLSPFDPKPKNRYNVSISSTQTPMTVSQSALAKVHDLYVMQIELWKHLREGNFQKADQRKETQKCLKQFSRLLDQVDWHYMGGEDVLAELRTMRGEVSAKLRNIRRRKKK